MISQKSSLSQIKPTLHHPFDIRAVPLGHLVSIRISKTVFFHHSKTNMFLTKGPCQNERIVFQPLFFSGGRVSFLGECHSPELMFQTASQMQKRKKTTRNYQFSYPIGSMYGIFTYIYHKDRVNVGKYTMDPMGNGLFQENRLCEM